jgi:hypothetical protein
MGTPLRSRFVGRRDLGMTVFEVVFPQHGPLPAESPGGFRNRICLLDATADRRAREIIAREENSGSAGAQVLKRAQHTPVTDVVLRQRAFPAGHVLRGGEAGYAQHRGEFRVRDLGDSRFAGRADFRIECSAKEAGEAGHLLKSLRVRPLRVRPLGDAFRKQR